MRRPLLRCPRLCCAHPAPRVPRLPTLRPAPTAPAAPLRLPPGRAFKPDVIHCSSPGIMWLAALIYSRLLKAPLVYSYHTHVPEYMPRWGPAAAFPVAFLGCVVGPSTCRGGPRLHAGVAPPRLAP